MEEHSSDHPGTNATCSTLLALWRLCFLVQALGLSIGIDAKAMAVSPHL